VINHTGASVETSWLDMGEPQPERKPRRAYVF